MRGLYGFLHRMLAVPFRFIFNIRVNGAENEPAPENGAYLVCSNHMSAWDPIWIGVATRRQQLHFMAKAELFRIPLISRFIRALGAYPVNRRTADVSSIKNAINLLKSGNSVGLFPQGTRRSGVNPCLTEVKNGAGMIALKAQAQVLPVFIGTKKFKSSAFTRKNITIGRPIPFSEIENVYNREGSYAAVSRLIFDRICALGGLTPAAKKINTEDGGDTVNE